MPIWDWIEKTQADEGRLLATRAVRKLARTVGRGKGKPAALDHAERFALTEEEQHYFDNGYDVRTPLPDGAVESLQQDSARLVELRRAYAGLDLTSMGHHLWAPERVSENVTLPYFRGDNLYVWQYPEHPRAMALTLFVYMRYVESRGGRPLLDRLSEDGAFGCWTTEVDGYGKISRDLLDSVNELLFLQRQLRILDRPGLRVLDIGAGYGRLAHRLSTLHPSLDDYSCVDAVPESTFLSEYYLRFRGVAPPARVVPLHRLTQDLDSGSFDLAVNIHSFSECTLAAIEWWLALCARLEVPHLFVVPNEYEGIISREVGGGYLDALPAFEAAGYRPTHVERVISDPAVREMVRIHDNFYLFERVPGS
jgi:SAM-dependent methyltransferase